MGKSITTCTIRKTSSTWEVIDRIHLDEFEISNVQISDKGQYIAFRSGSKSVLQSTVSNVKQEFPGSELKLVSGTDIAFEKSRDTVRFYTYENDRLRLKYSKTGVTHERILNIGGTKLMVYQNGNELVVLNLISDKVCAIPT